MNNNDIFLRKISGNSLFEAAYRCRIGQFSQQYIPVNHWPAFDEVLEIPLNQLTDEQSHCISRLIIPPNIATSIGSKGNLAGDVQRLISRDPFEDWY